MSHNYYDDLIKHSHYRAADVPVKFHSDWKSLNPNLAPSRLHEILRYDVHLLSDWNPKIELMLFHTLSGDSLVTLHSPTMSGDIYTYEGDPSHTSINIDCIRPFLGWGDALFIQVNNPEWFKFMNISWQFKKLEKNIYRSEIQITFEL